MLGLAGVIDTDCRVAAVTVNVWGGLVIPDRLAVMLVVPTDRVFARPVALIADTAGLLEFQVAVFVISSVEPSLNEPIAVNCCVNPYPFARFGLVGVTAIDCNVAVVTVNAWAELVIPDKLAVILVVPAATGLASPVAVIAATAALLELQVAELVTSNVEPLLSMAIAVNCSVNPLYTFDMLGLTGVIAIDLKG